MTMEEIMRFRSFAILGDTLNPEKYAFRIRNAMLDAGYQVFAVPKELPSLNDIGEEIQVIDLCIHPVKGLKLLQENRKPFEFIVIQPGAEDEALISWLDQEKIPYVRGCLLKALKEQNA